MTLQKSHAFTPKNKLIRSTSYKTSDHRAIQAIISQGDFTKVPRRSSRYYYSVQTGECDICPIGLFKVGKNHMVAHWFVYFYSCRWFIHRKLCNGLKQIFANRLSLLIRNPSLKHFIEFHQKVMAFPAPRSIDTCNRHFRKL